MACGDAKVYPLLDNLPTTSLQHHPLSSTKRTFANLMLCIVGTGILGLPYTFSSVGWLIGFFILALSGSIAYYGMMLLVSSKRRFQRSHGDLLVASYGDLCFHTFGTAGRMTVDILLALSSVACGISYFTFISQNLASIASSIEGDGVSAAIGSWNHSLVSAGGVRVSASWNPARASIVSATGGEEISAAIGSWNDAQTSITSVEAFDGVSDAVNRDQATNSLGSSSWTSKSVYVWMIFPLEVALAAIPSVTYLAPMSTVADAMNLCAVGAVMVSDVLAIRTVGIQPAVKAIGELLAVPSAFGVGVYAFQSAGMMIPLEMAMQEPSKLGALLGLAFVLSGLLYAAFGALGFAAFGDETQQIITLNLQDGVEASVIKGALCVGLFFAFPLMLNPMCEVVERRFTSRKHSLSLRALVVALICLLATAVKHFTDFLSLAGSSISCLLGFIIPAAVHLKVIKLESEKCPELQHQTSAFEIAANYVLIALGLVFGVFGTTVSFLDLL